MSDLIGNKLPNETLVFMDKDKGPQPLKILDFAKGKIVIWCTRCIHTNMFEIHLPGFGRNADKIREKAVDETIVCFATNDIFTMSAWKKCLDQLEKIKFLSDSKAEFAKSLAQTTPIHLEHRSRRKDAHCLLMTELLRNFLSKLMVVKLLLVDNKMLDLL